jgi:hypothetical protein
MPAMLHLMIRPGPYELEKVETKLEQIQSDMASLKSSIEIIKPIAKSVGKGKWAIGILLATLRIERSRCLDQNIR